jgi:hypothetical protein
MNGAERNAYRILLGKPEGKSTLGRPRCKWVDNIKIVLSEIGWGGMDWIDLAEDRDQWRGLVNTVMNLRVLHNFGKFLGSCITGSLSRRAHVHEVSKLVVHFRYFVVLQLYTFCC